MRIALTIPATWPRVRRGSERFFNELAGYLAARGHEVTLISSKPGAGETTRQNGFTTICYRRFWHPLFARFGLLEFHLFFFNTLFALLRRRFDVVQSCTFMDAWAATLTRRITGAPCIFWVNSVPPPVQYFRSLSTGGAVIRRAVRNVDEMVSISGFVEEYMEERYGRGGIELPVPVDTDTFALSTERAGERPIIFCASALDDTRKGGSLLMRAFNQVKQQCPDAILEIAYPLAADSELELLQQVDEQWREDVRITQDPVADLPRLFGRATVSVLPSIWEAFGMVVLESMATGTPVVGTRNGALPELICDDSIGRLYDPGEIVDAAPTNVDGLTQALLEGLELGRKPETAAACRAHALRYSWAEVGPRYEALYERLLRDRSC